MNRSAAGMLGILNRAGLLAFGGDVTAKMRKASLVLLAGDASENTLGKVMPLIRQYGVETITIATKEELGAPLGYPELSCVLLLQGKAAKSFKEKLQKGD